MALDDAAGPDPVDIAIGARMRLRRKSLGISQGALADQIGVSFQQVQKYERGANRVSGSTLVAVAAALDTTVGWLVGEEGAISDAADDIVQALAVSGAVDLLEAFVDIPKASARTALVALAREMAVPRSS
ncbi:helix-turn-helix domain-containing protein [Phenylobacterium sp. LH3H17]|uniref:helix-turn-helix domain-containing protein n=1 Tax=Phenylobacterium sp. LH3H17 TaxID=2903901 RepID=UPI0020C9A1A8|nr:helix-turn-helix domain-containing protein [Phenylobacterium sp. LH3H17]UTP39743.1 helix-turn-helix domain-containing protein [Phenylobacterium sp. LH3H17]